MTMRSTYDYYRTVHGLSVRDALNMTGAVFNVHRSVVVASIAR